jgi:hypothetical protein
MSRLDDDIKNPAKAFLKWKGTGGFEYFDKSKGEKGEKVAVALPFEFLALDTLATVKGYSDSAQSGFWSNEVRNIGKDILTVRNKTGIVAKGTYTEVMASKATTGAKFCQSVYIVANIEGKSVIANIQMMGTALSAWIDFGKTNKIFKGAIKVASMKEGKKGATVYQTPIFEAIEVTPETDAKAKEMAKELKVYLEAYFGEKQKENELPPINS